MIPERFGDDEAFLFAQSIERDDSRERWHVKVDPDDCLVGPAVDLDIEELRADSCNIEETPRGDRYTGRLLLSAGVVCLLNGKLVLLRRDQNAGTGANQWQSPSGRCAELPWETALREFYEELVVLEDSVPAFLAYEGRSTGFEDVYAASLARLDIGAAPDTWQRYDGRVPPIANEQYWKIELEYGRERASEEMLAFFDEDASTLELRLVLEVTIDQPDAVRLLDPEFDRPVERFAPVTLAGMRADLVPTDRHLAETLYPAFG